MTHSCSVAVVLPTDEIQSQQLKLQHTIYTHTHIRTETHTCSEVQDAVVLVIDRQHDVRHGVCDLVVRGQVERSNTDWPDHVLDFWVVSDHPKVLDVVVTSGGRRVFAHTLRDKVM